MRDKEYSLVIKKLYSYTTNQAIIKNTTIDLDRIENKYRAGMIQKGMAFDDIRVSKTNSEYPIEDWLLYHDEEYDRLLKKKLKAVDEVKKIDNALEVLNDFEKRVIELKYFKDKQWIIIGDILDRSSSHCKNVRNKAINKLKKVLL